jgi:hypothetical protein
VDFSKRWGTEVAVGKQQVRVIQEIEQLSPELQFLAFRNRDVLERDEIPGGEPGALHHVAAFVAELLNRGVGIGCNPLKCAGVEPLLRGARTGVRISDQIRTVAGEISGALRCREISLGSNTVNRVPRIRVRMPLNCQLPNAC